MGYMEYWEWIVLPTMMSAGTSAKCAGDELSRDIDWIDGSRKDVVMR